MDNVKYIPGDLMKHITTGKICKLINISIDRDYIIEECDTHTRICTDIGKLSSIPLTPQILEANGWGKLYNVYGIPSFYHREAEFLIVTFESDNCRAYSFNTLLLEFKYLHELQHLLFGLGLDSSLKV